MKEQQSNMPQGLYQSKAISKNFKLYKRQTLFFCAADVWADPPW